MTRRAEERVARRWKQKGARSQGQAIPQRCKIAAGPFPTDRYRPPESITRQAEISPEEGEEDGNTHTAEEVPLHENQGELRLGPPPCSFSS